MKGYCNGRLVYVDVVRPQGDLLRQFDRLIVDGVQVVWAVEPVDSTKVRAFVRPLREGE